MPTRSQHSPAIPSRPPSGTTRARSCTSTWHTTSTSPSSLPRRPTCIAKLATGIADDLLTSTLLETTCPLILAPAMHTGMWQHPATAANVATLRERGAVFVGPVVGALAAGDEGLGRMAEPEQILQAIVAHGLGGSRDLDGIRMVVTAGPTQEPIDPVRFIGNRSTGKMGVAVAAEAASRGAEVRLILGPGHGVAAAGHRYRPRRAPPRRCSGRSSSRADDADVVVMAAAVADFRPKAAADGKLKKESGRPRAASGAHAGHHRRAGGAQRRSDPRRVRRGDVGPGGRGSFQAASANTWTMSS